MPVPKQLQSMRWARVGDTHVSFVEVGTPIPDELWDQCMDDRRDPAVQRCLVIVANNGFPQMTHRQWRYAASVMIERQYPVAVLSTHRNTLAIVKSANWNGAFVHTYPLHEMDAALEFLAVPPEQHVAVRELATRLRDGQ